MTNTKPTFIAIDPDDDFAEYCGTTKTGYQFFLTTLFDDEPEDSEGCNYIALFIFGKRGIVIEEKTIIEKMGPNSEKSAEQIKTRFNQLLQALGEVSFCRINIVPFAIKKFETEFGFIAREAEDDDDIWSVELMPGMSMAFYEPWDSGEYDS